MSKANEAVTVHFLVVESREEALKRVKADRDYMKTRGSYNDARAIKTTSPDGMKGFLAVFNDCEIYSAYTWKQ